MGGNSAWDIPAVGCKPEEDRLEMGVAHLQAAGKPAYRLSLGMAAQHQVLDCR